MRCTLPIVFAAVAFGAPADRKAAEFTLAMGGRVQLVGQPARITDPAQLPEGDFALDTLDWVGVNVEPQDLERLSGLRALRRLFLPGPIWNRNADSGRDGSRDFKYLAPIKTLEVITFSYHFLDKIRFKDDGIEELAPLENLKELVVRQSAVKGHHLGPFRNLEALDVTLCPFDDEGMRHLQAMPRLRRLLAGDTAITDAGLQALRAAVHLEQLDLHGTAVTDAGIVHLAALKNLRKLNLMGTAVTDAGLAVLAGLENLEELNLYRTKVSNAGLESLQRLKRLRELDVRYSRATAGAVAALRAGLPQTRVFFISPGASRQAVPADPALPLPEWVRRIGGVVETDAISLAATPVTDAQLVKLADAKGLRRLSLEGTEVGDAGLAHLAALSDLEELNLSNTTVSGKGLASLRALSKLRKVTLANTYVEGDGLEHLTAVADLDLHGSPVGNEAIERLAALPQLQRLSLAATDIADGVELDRLQSLVSLDLGATDLTDAGLKPLGALKRLQSLVLRDSRFTDAGLAHLLPLEDLRELDLIRTRISDQGMALVGKLTRLERLYLDYGEIYDAGLARLSPLTKLTDLTLDSTHITDAAVATLKALPALRHLNLYHTLVTKAGLGELKTALPQCRIVWDAASNLPNRRRS